MFQFSRFPPHSLCIQLWVVGHYPDGVSPFGYLWINTSVQLPRAFRRYRVLLRQLVPRHSSHTLLSFILVALSSARYISSLHRYATVKRLSRRPLPLLLSGQQTETIPARSRHVKGVSVYFQRFLKSSWPRSHPGYGLRPCHQGPTDRLNASRRRPTTSESG